MFDVSITVRVIVVVFMIILGSVLSLFTPLKPVPFAIVAAGYQVIDGLIYYLRFKQ